jgi:UDP-arabinose 4-epimerase
MRENILVTGGAGYIGAHVCKTLSRNGFLPVTYDNLYSGSRGHVQWGPLEEGDIRDRTRLAEVIRKYNIKSVIHLAAFIQVGESVSDPAKYYDNNVYGSLCLLEEARSHGIKHIVFSSTAAVYGVPDAKVISEDHPLRPINPYGQTKLAVENIIRDYSVAYGLNYAILRYFNVAGADADAEVGASHKAATNLIPLLMRVASGDMPEIKVFGMDYDSADGTAVRDYIHVQDLAEAHVLALRRVRETCANLTLNLGTSQGYTVQEVIDMARQVTQHPIPARKGERRPGDPTAVVANATQAHNVLNWRPSRSDLNTIISTAWKWRRKQILAEMQEQDNAA